MSAKIFIYLFSLVVVIWSIDSVNITAIFKKNKIVQARIFYFVLALCLTELLTELIYNIFEAVRIF